MRNKSIFFIVLGSVVASLLLAACSNPAPSPKPYGYHRLVLPEHTYQKFECKQCPMEFEYPTYGIVQMIPADSCVFDISYPSLGCKWHVTVEPIKDGFNYRRAVEKYRSMIYQHSRKGRIYETIIATNQGTGILFEIYGEVPTTKQLYFSDTSRYAIAASLYFETALKNDSLAPVIDFMQKDMLNAAQTLIWRESYAKKANTNTCL